jgi:3-methyladenine DNA glycosylase/8-oxoguanine DNA glycosylase
VVRQRSAKPLSVGSIPTVASTTLPSAIAVNSIDIPTPPDFDFAATVDSHGWRRLAPFEWRAEEEILVRAEEVGNSTVELELSHRDHVLTVRADRSLSQPAQKQIRARCRRMLQLDVSLAEFHELCLASPDHRIVAERRFGRLLCGSTMFEDAVKIITTTNTMWRQTVRMVDLLVETCGRKGRTRRAFPTPAAIARRSPAELQEVCRLGYRAKSIHALAVAVDSGQLDLKALSDPSLATEELFRNFRTLPGIGPYGAAHLMAMEGRHDFIAVDTEFRRFVREKFHGGRHVRDDTMVRHYRTWGRWQYLAYWSELWLEIGGK